MRQYLLTAAAVAPLLLACAGAARAQTTIAEDLTTPLITSDIAVGAGDITITAEGSVILNGAVAVTIDSDNNFINQGSITMAEAPDGATGVLILAPRAANFTNSGSINIGEEYEAEDINEDGLIDGPFAQGSGRYGVRVMGAGAWTGDLDNGGSITVEGNNSYGISIESAMSGDITSSGTISIVGDNSVGLRETAGVDGEIRLDGALTANGVNAIGVDLEGDVTGALRIYSQVAATAYRVTSRPNNPAILENLLPENMLQSGSAVRVRGDVLGGIFIGAPPPITDIAGDDDDDDDGIPDAEEDNDGDGVPDVSEGTGQVQVFGSAPAVHIGEDGEDLLIGAFGEGQNAYGLIVRGVVTASGVFDDVSATAVQIGTGAGGVDIEGGIRVVGVLDAAAYEADATALRIRPGAKANALINEGRISSAIASTASDNAYGVLIEEGGSLTSLNNSGSIVVTGNGASANAYAIVDRSGDLSSINNTLVITARRRSTVRGVPAAGETVALDLRANTSGVTLVQDPNPGSTDEAPILPAIEGDVLLGAGNDTVRLRAGSVVGMLDFAGGAGVFSIENGSIYRGDFRSGGSMAISIANGLLDQRGTTTVEATSLDIGAQGTLVFAADPANDRASRFNVAGNASIADGGKIGLAVLSLPQETETFTVLDAESLTVGGQPDALLESSPFIVVSSANIDEASGDITISLRRKAAEEAGFAKFEADAYDAVYEGVGLDAGILAAVLGQTDRDGLLGVYDQLLPDHAGGVVRGLSWAQEAAARGAADWPRHSEMTGPTRAWTQEIGLGETKDRKDAAGWDIYGFGAAGGIESVAANGSALGLMINFTAANIKNPDTPGDDIIGASQLGAASYWRGAFGRLRADAQAGAGFVWADSRRQFIATVDDVVVLRQANADWTGYSLYGRLGLAYELSFGAFTLLPMTHIDYYRLQEQGYTETGGGEGFDLVVESRNSDVLSWTSSVLVGYNFGSRTIVRPEIELGWRQVLSGSGGRTTGRFSGGGTPFTLFGEVIEGGAPIARVGVRISNRYLDLKLDAGGEFRDEYTDLDLRLTARIVF